MKDSNISNINLIHGMLLKDTEKKKKMQSAATKGKHYISVSDQFYSWW